MKPVMSLVATALMVLFLSRAGAQIRLQSPKTSTPFDAGSTNLTLGSSNQPQGKLFRPLPPIPKSPLPEAPRPEIPPPEIPKQNLSTGPLPPGVYETKPYAGIVVVPPSEHDDCSVLNAGSIYPSSRMPIIHPHIQAIPQGPTKP